MARADFLFREWSLFRYVSHALGNAMEMFRDRWNSGFNRITKTGNSN